MLITEEIVKGATPWQYHFVTATGQRKPGSTGKTHI
jgi:hypothetical protein